MRREEGGEGEKYCQSLGRDHLSETCYSLAYSAHLIKVPPDSSDIWCDGTKVVPRLPVTDVACTDDLLDLARHE